MTDKKRGGPRTPGPGKKLGRPPVPDHKKKKRREFHVSDEVWNNAIRVCEQEIGATGKTESHVLAEALKRLLAGKWRLLLVEVEE